MGAAGWLVADISQAFAQPGMEQIRRLGRGKTQTVDDPGKDLIPVKGTHSQTLEPPLKSVDVFAAKMTWISDAIAGLRQVGKEPTNCIPVLNDCCHRSDRSPGARGELEAVREYPR